MLVSTRCTSHGLECVFPERSYRGRRPGSTNRSKKETAAPLTGSGNDNAISDEVVVSLLGTCDPGLLPHTAIAPGTAEQDDATTAMASILENRNETTWTPKSLAVPGIADQSSIPRTASELESSRGPHVLSGVTKRFLLPQTENSQSSTSSNSVISRKRAPNKRLITYFGMMIYSIPPQPMYAKL